jgi:hypothetical protein
LRQIVDCGAGLGEAIPGIGLHQPGRNAQEGGLTGAVAPDQADPVTGGDGQLRAGKQGRNSKGETDVLEQKQRGRHGEADITGSLRPGESLDLSGSGDHLRGVEMTRLMHEFPPSADSQVTPANWRQAPFGRWAFHHVRELVPSADIPNDPGGVHDWPLDRLDLGEMPIEAGESDRFRSMNSSPTRAPTASSSSAVAGSSSSDTPTG